MPSTTMPIMQIIACMNQSKLVDELSVHGFRYKSIHTPKPISFHILLIAPNIYDIIVFQSKISRPEDISIPIMMDLRVKQFSWDNFTIMMIWVRVTRQLVCMLLSRSKNILFPIVWGMREVMLPPINRPNNTKPTQTTTLIINSIILFKREFQHHKSYSYGVNGQSANFFYKFLWMEELNSYYEFPP